MINLYKHQADELEATKDTKFKSGKNHVNYKHGLYKNRLYSIWSNMKSRCYCETYYLYKDYGARGITVCEEWKTDFTKFYDWAMKNGYQENLSIDRIDNNKGYLPDNCRWVTMKTQNRNRRNNHLITYNNKTQCVMDWANELGIKRQTIEKRLKLGWNEVDALTTPVRKRVVQ